MNSYGEKKMCIGAKIQFCTDLVLCAKAAQDYLLELRLALSIKRKVLRYAAHKTTPMSLAEEHIARKDSRHSCYIISRSHLSTPTYLLPCPIMITTI